MNMRAARSFTHGNTGFHMEYGPANQCWFVWRLDGRHQACLRLYNDFNEALEDYQQRIAFYADVVGLDLENDD